jgi:hypothetical protein
MSCSDEEKGAGGRGGPGDAAADARGRMGGWRSGRSDEDPPPCHLGGHGESFSDSATQVRGVGPGFDPSVVGRAGG